MKYLIEVSRQSSRTISFTVEAKNAEEAQEKALLKAYDTDFASASEQASEYFIDGVTPV